MDNLPDSQDGLKPWSPEILLKRVSAVEARYSKGFLRSEPAGWFPGLAAHWLPLQHSAGVEIKILQTKPVIELGLNEINVQLLNLAGWYLDHDAVALYADEKSQRVIAHALLTTTAPLESGILLDYLARRLAHSLLASWSGMQTAKLSYDPEFNFASFRPEAFVLIKGLINGEKINFCVGLMRDLVEKLDGLWRRQIRSGWRSSLAEKMAVNSKVEIRVELARLSVAPHSLTNYLRSGSLVDLELPISPKVYLKFGEEVWLGADLVNSDGQFGFEINSLHPVLPQVASGTTALVVEFGHFPLNLNELAEVEQNGAVLTSPLPLSERVDLVIRGEKLAEAKLVNYQDRFALSMG